MKPYPVQLEISGPTAMWTRPDTGSSPVSYVAPTFSAVKGIFESVYRAESVQLVDYEPEALIAFATVHGFVDCDSHPCRDDRAECCDLACFVGQE